MLRGRHGDLVVGEDLVDVRVERDIVDPRCRVHETVPVRSDALEGVVDGDDRIAVVLAYGTPAVVVVLLDRVHIERGAERLVDELDHGDGGVGGVALGEEVDGLFRGVAAGVCGLPFDGTEVAGVVEAVLGAGR